MRRLPHRGKQGGWPRRAHHGAGETSARCLLVRWLARRDCVCVCTCLCTCVVCVCRPLHLGPAYRRRRPERHADETRTVDGRLIIAGPPLPPAVDPPPARIDLATPRARRKDAGLMAVSSPPPFHISAHQPASLGRGGPRTCREAPRAAAGPGGRGWLQETTTSGARIDGCACLALSPVARPPPPACMHACICARPGRPRAEPCAAGRVVLHGRRRTRRGIKHLLLRVGTGRARCRGPVARAGTRRGAAAGVRAPRRMGRREGMGLGRLALPCAACALRPGADGAGGGLMDGWLADSLDARPSRCSQTHTVHTPWMHAGHAAHNPAQPRMLVYAHARIISPGEGRGPIHDTRTHKPVQPRQDVPTCYCARTHSLPGT